MLQIPLPIPLGVDSDASTMEANGAADVNNVRPWHGGWQTIGGSAPIAGLENLTGGAVRAVFGMMRGAFLNMFYATSQKLWRGLAFGVPTDVTPTSTPSSTTDAWSLQAWGGTSSALLLFNWTDGSGGQSTLYEQSGSSQASAVSGAPARIQWILVTPERQVLALGCNEEGSGTYNALCIRGSDIEDYADWTTTPTNNAFEQVLEGGGMIVAGRIVGSHVAVWTDSELYIGQFIGDPSQTYRFDRVAKGCGLCNPLAVTELAGVIYWVDRTGQLWAWAPGALPERIPSPISRDIAGNAISFGTSRVGPLRRYKEIWVLYDDARDVSAPSGANTRYFAYCVEESARQGRPIWYQGQLARSAIIDDQLMQPSLLSLKTAVLMGDHTGTIHLHEYDANAPDDAHIQSADQYFDEGRRRFMIQRIRPDFEAQSGSVAFTVFMRDYPQGDVRTSGPHILAASQDRKDFRTSGNLASIKFSGTGVSWRIGKPVVEGVLLGDR